MNENEILDEAIGQLTQHTGIIAHWEPRPDMGLDRGIDATLTINAGDRKIIVQALVKRTLQPYQLNGFIRQVQEHHPLLVVAEQIYTGMKELLRENNIGYLDGAGNIYLQAGDQLIWIEGQKPKKHKEPATNRAFTRAGLQTVFYLLQHPEAINDPYRQLTDRTGTALGNIRYIFDGLKTAGYILPLDKKQVRLIKKKALRDRWIEGYRETLKPALHLGNFRLKDPNLFYDRNRLIGKVEGAVWGGEPAAEILTNHLQPGILTLYTPLTANTIMREWKLIPDPKGNIRVYRKFWKEPDWDNQHIAPPLLIYADLLVTGDPRNLETAGLIHHQYLENELE
jgi:hypothetical protein